MLEFGMDFINSLQGQKLWERNCCPSQLLSHTPVTLPCGVEFRAQLVPNPRKCLYSLHQIGLLFFLGEHLQVSDCKWCGCLQWRCMRPSRGTVCYGTQDSWMFLGHQ